MILIPFQRYKFKRDFDKREKQIVNNQNTQFEGLNCNVSLKASRRYLYFQKCKFEVLKLFVAITGASGTGKTT